MKEDESTKDLNLAALTDTKSKKSIYKRSNQTNYQQLSQKKLIWVNIRTLINYKQEIKQLGNWPIKTNNKINKVWAKFHKGESSEQEKKSLAEKDIWSNLCIIEWYWGIKYRKVTYLRAKLYIKDIVRPTVKV